MLQSARFLEKSTLTIASSIGIRVDQPINGSGSSRAHDRHRPHGDPKLVGDTV
jgi:hypothetical protein